MNRVDSRRFACGSWNVISQEISRTLRKRGLESNEMQATCTLLSKVHSVKDAAYPLHFKHSSHFCREFKRHYGMTPSQFVRAQAMHSSIYTIRPLDSG
jgi:AraC-like DNA-binding protein